MMTIFRIDIDALAQSSNSADVRSLFKDLAAKIRELEPKLKKAVAKAKSLHSDVAGGLTAPDSDSIDLLADACDGEIEVFRKLRKELDAIQALVDLIKKDKEFVAEKVKELLPLIKGLGNEKTDCEGWIAQLEEDKRRAQKAAAAHAKSDAQLAKAIEESAKKIASFRKPLKHWEGVGPLLTNLAIKVAKSGDRESYRDVADRFREEYNSFSFACQEFNEYCDKVLADIKRAYGPQVLQLPAIKELMTVRGEAKKAEAEAEQFNDKVQSAEPKPVDARRAAKVLGLERYQSELTKILDGPGGEVEKGLEALGTRAGQKSASGKEMRALLVKAKAL